MKLFDIDEKLAACVKLDESRVVDTESGEIIDLEAIAALEMERDKKIENLGCWYKNLLADAEALKAQKNAFAEREKAAKAKAESLKGFLGRYLNGKKFETAKVAMSFRKSEAVEFDAKCIGDVPEEFLKFKDPELDKVAVKKAIKAGETVPGCELVQRQNLQIK
ncbi:siphovirus Gp157 family protein [uncultured Phascolarctobacterium sp.]|uniref:siphovirus Gp157 family protein n=1 Tax=uncultured Phascolarctobacterium sp. TaxID=512296 RepID=UPI0025CD6954|nr:siphovirus Gp157 family protein [uncultured Phascolarctobacterium sp.]